MWLKTDYKNSQFSPTHVKTKRDYKQLKQKNRWAVYIIREGNENSATITACIMYD